jgi:RHS repeat-associated protein
MSVHSQTPSVSVSDPRGLTVRSVGYWRVLATQPLETRVQRTARDAAGRAVKEWDPRLWAQQAPPSQASVWSLAATLLGTHSVDAGRQLRLPDPGGQPVMTWDARQTRTAIDYDLLRRPLAIFRQGLDEPRRCIERFLYGDPHQGAAACNQLGRLLRHDDPAGSVLFQAYALSGPCSTAVRHFSREPITPDWPQPIDERQALLEPGAGAISRWRYGALGDVLEQVDARDNRHVLALTVDGRLRERQLQLHGQPARMLYSAMAYTAEGSVARVVAGNGVQTTFSYQAQTGRLQVRHATAADGRVLQHLVYAYDRTGNVLSIEDQALPIRYFANQRIEPVSRYAYDSLYQLAEASGWEAGSASQGPASRGRVDPAALSNYRQIYDYDASGNLLKLTHVGAQSHGRNLRPARHSNRALPYDHTPPSEAQIAAAFDACGNLLQIDTRTLRWNLANQLQVVTPVERSSGQDDCEHYLYDGGGRRVRKLRSLQAQGRTLLSEVRYLPGLELRTDSARGEVLQVIDADSVRVLHWESPPPSGGNDQYRYSLADHLGSVSLELAGDARLISHEVFYPFGETAYLAGADAIEVAYKTVRYSGKERDATGLYAFGRRYYIPWLQRWASTDPAGHADGANLYRMVHNNPLTFTDGEGALTRRKQANGLWEPLIATGDARVLAGAVQVDRGHPLRSVPATGKPGNIAQALEAREFGRTPISSQFLDPVPGRYSSDTVAQLSRRHGGGEMIFSVDRLSYSGASKGEFNALRIVDIAKGEIPDKHNAVAGYWAPQGGHVDIPLHPTGTQPDHVFTPSFSGCSLTVDQLSDNVLRVRHVEGGKENAQYNDLPAREHGMGQAAAMEFADYGYAEDEKGRLETLTTGFAFMKYDRKQQAWNIHYQTIQGASGIERYTPGSSGLFKRTNASVSVYAQSRVRKAMARKVEVSQRRTTG